MAKFELKPQTPLGGTVAKVDEFDTVSLSENIHCALASLALRRGKERGFNSAAKTMFKADLPGPNQMVCKGDYTVFWATPEQWFVEAPIGSHEDLADILKPAFNDNGSITEQSGGWVRFDLTGKDCVPVLERLCGVDTATMPENAAIRTVMEHIGVFVLCYEPGTHFAIYGPRSSARSLHHALVTAIKSAT